PAAELHPVAGDAHGLVVVAEHVDGGGELRGEAVEPDGLGVVGGARLAGHGPVVEAGGGAGAVLDDLPHRVHGVGGGPLADGLGGDRPDHVLDAVGVRDRSDDVGLHVDA